MSDAGLRALTLGLLAALGLYCAARLELTHSITHFLPSEADPELVELSIQLVDSPLTRRMVLAVGGGPGRDAAAAELGEVLRSHSEVTWVETGFDEEAMRSVYELYFDRRIYLASDAPDTEIPRMLDAKHLQRSAGRLRSRLAQPASPAVSRMAPADPLGLFERILDRIRAAQPAISTGVGGFASSDGGHAIVLLGLRSSPFDSSRQAPFLRDLEQEFSRLAAAHGGGLVLEKSGVNQIAVASERSVRGDINFISAVSIAGVCTLFLLVFRSLRHLFIAILAPLSAFAAATAMALFTSPPLHGITLGFGFVLIGVTIDYPIHLMTHHALSPEGTRPRDTAARLRVSLLLSGVTTTLAFATLALSDFPGLREMGSFAAIGVPAGLALTTLLLPAFLGRGGTATPVQIALSAGLGRLVRWLGGHRGLAVAIPATCAVISAVGVPQLRWEDDPATLMAADPSLLAEHERVRRRVVDVDDGRFVVALAPDAESALALNDRIDSRLGDAVAEGHLGGVRSLHSFLWSQELQRENLAAFRSAPDLGGRIERAFSARGFRPDAFESFTQAVASPVAAPLRPEDLAGSPLERALDSMVRLDEGWAVVTSLREVRSGEGVRDALAGLEGAHYVDQQEIVTELYEGYRRSTLRMLGLASVVVFVVLQLRYRSLRRGLLAFLPSVLVALTTLGLFGMLGITVNVIATVSLVVVLGMGVDYGIFSVDGAQRPERLGATMSSLLVSCLTTIFVFGTLALSSHPALRAIGLTTASGILLALLLSPAVFVLASRATTR